MATKKRSSTSHPKQPAAQPRITLEQFQVDDATLQAFQLDNKTLQVLAWLERCPRPKPFLTGITGAHRSQMNALRHRRLIRRTSRLIELTKVGKALLKAIRATPDGPAGSRQPVEAKAPAPMPEHQPELEVALRPQPHVEGRIVMTPQCAYSPLCAGVPAFGGVLVTFLDGPDDEYRTDLEHRNYCSTLHAAMALLGEWADVWGCNEDVVDLVRRSLDGEPMLGDRVSQTEVDSQVKRTLEGGANEN